MIDENATNMTYKMNGFAQNSSNRFSNQSEMNGHQQNSQKSEAKTNGVHDHNETKVQANGSELSNGCHGSPLRSQLGLNLKAPTVSVKKTPNLLQVSVDEHFIICEFFLISHL